jgi:hypothetical protein
MFNNELRRVGHTSLSLRFTVRRPVHGGRNYIFQPGSSPARRYCLATEQKHRQVKPMSGT